MPELPEVETIVRGLSRHLIGKKLQSVNVLFPSIIRGTNSNLHSTLSNSTLIKLDRYGKSLLFSFDSNIMRVHLGMTGQLVLEKPESPVLKHTHLIFQFAGMDRQLRYRDIRRFGCVELVNDQQMKKLGPDAWLAPLDRIYETLKQKSARAKHSLLNQYVIAGLGNIYVDESLYRSRIHPNQILSRLSDRKLKDLCRSIKEVLKESIDVGGTTFQNYVNSEGKRGEFKARLLVFSKDGNPCPRCKATIQKKVIAGRGTHYCPRCQRM